MYDIDVVIYTCLYMYLDTQFTQTIYENTSTITGDLRWNTYFNLLIEGQITTGMHICAVSALVPPPRAFQDVHQRFSRRKLAVDQIKGL